jgi:cytochrome b pre-mRNA-processing protein 3
MILAQWRARRANRILIDQLHGKIVAASRRPALYSEFGVPDTFDGRFEMVTLYAGLVMRRLTPISSVGAEMAQELADSVFRHFEVALRETGVGDVAVPKRLKRMGEAFYGRIKAYGEALDASDADRLIRALARNVFGIAETVHAPMAADLAPHVRAAADALDGTPFEVFAAGEVSFPDITRTPIRIEAAND